MAKWMIRLIDLRVEKLTGAHVREIVASQLSTQGVRVSGGASPVLDHKGPRPDEWCLTIEDARNRELSIVHLMLADLLPRFRMRLLNVQLAEPPAQRQAPRGERSYPPLRLVDDGTSETRPLPVTRPRARRVNDPYGTISGPAPYAGECR